MEEKLSRRLLLASAGLIFLLATINSALAAGELAVRAEFDPEKPSHATIYVTTPEAATCKYDALPKEYANMKLFQQTGETAHKQNIVLQGTMTLYVTCMNAQGDISEMTQVKLQAPITQTPIPKTRNAITGQVIAKEPSYNGIYYLVGLLMVTTLLGYSIGRKKTYKYAPYRNLPQYHGMDAKVQYPSLSSSIIKDLLHKANKEIDHQHFQESLTKYKYLLQLMDTHKLESQRAGEEEQISKQIQTLYYKLDVYNQLLWAKQYWKKKNTPYLRRTLQKLQQDYDYLRSEQPSALLNNAFKSYEFYNRHLKQA